MAKKTKKVVKNTGKKRAKKYSDKLSISGTIDDVLKAAIKGKTSKY